MVGDQRSYYLHCSHKVAETTPCRMMFRYHRVRRTSKEQQVQSCTGAIFTLRSWMDLVAYSHVQGAARLDLAHYWDMPASIVQTADPEEALCRHSNPAGGPSGCLRQYVGVQCQDPLHNAPESVVWYASYCSSQQFRFGIGDRHAGAALARALIRRRDCRHTTMLLALS